SCATAPRPPQRNSVSTTTTASPDFVTLAILSHLAATPQGTNVWQTAKHSPLVVGEAEADRHVRAALDRHAVAAGRDEAPVRANGRNRSLIEHRVTRRANHAHLAGPTVGCDDDPEEDDPFHAHAAGSGGVGGERIHAVGDPRFPERSARAAPATLARTSRGAPAGSADTRLPARTRGH